MTSKTKELTREDLTYLGRHMYFCPNCEIQAKILERNKKEVNWSITLECDQCGGRYLIIELITPTKTIADVNLQWDKELDEGRIKVGEGYKKLKKGQKKSEIEIEREANRIMKFFK